VTNMLEWRSQIAAEALTLGLKIGGKLILVEKELRCFVVPMQQQHIKPQAT
jgi:hypothetical protein